MSVTAGISPGFHHALYPTTRVGGGPEPYIFSPADQALANYFALQRTQRFVLEITRDYMDLGLYYPVAPQPLPEENGAGVLVSLVA